VLTVHSDMAELLPLLDTLADAPADLLNRLPGVSQLLDEIAHTEVFSESTGALELTVRFKPTDRLVGYVSALRALQADGLV
jgi:hypothetical protein